jgi:hypothetical protein
VGEGKERRKRENYWILSTPLIFVVPRLLALRGKCEKKKKRINFQNHSSS